MTNRNSKDYKDEIEYIRKRIKKGDAMHDIGMSLNLDKKTISRRCKKHNIKPVNKFPNDNFNFKNRGFK
tara:strand:+ start:104 stop:310 length:207 start_codon:yes stop_codon:yes gene_type:complete